MSVIRRRMRRTWLPMLASAAWMNRHDIKRWARFVRRVAQQRTPFSEALLEARVRASVTANPLLRRDHALEDVRVDDGVVTLLTTTASWPDPRDQIWQLKRVKGVTDVRSTVATASR